ncbi:bifunctional 2-polyprenyl-6-hydroxyphenol methylase/3-demethylubiquinol 3-O-methyltransferase UbiG [Synechococcus sp. CS-1328]|uniref:class I SAM-dependent methyltransferase n=1 Tax=Synechococcus sp. CS-1328 TaxID=2847976 RepID=UPI00223AF2ED|nr:class I SAM-dependent methyltransferase [Synechococcus sp. CS-1328]MCT0224384.1 class I SAM-dependent methyltransferase [Synechococcus sp. CS-1328]
MHLPILDWGCGNGHISCFLLEAGYTQIHCYAFRPPALISSDACRDGRVTIHVANKRHGSSIPLPSCSFQTVLSIGVLEHVRETGGTEIESLREINRILRDGGRLIGYHLPNVLSPIEALSRLLPGKYHHQYLFRRNQVVNLLDQAGFSVSSSPSMGSCPGICSRGL